MARYVRVRPDGTVRLPSERHNQVSLILLVVKVAVGFVMLAVALHRWYPELDITPDIPHVPFIACGSNVMRPLPDSPSVPEGPTRKPVGGLKGDAYRAGDVLRQFADGPPKVKNVTGSFVDLGKGGGDIWGQVQRAFGGKPPQLEPVAPKVKAVPSSRIRGVSDGCTPCPSAHAAPARTSALDGGDVAARAALRAGSDWSTVTAVAIARAESGWRHDARNPLTVSGSNAVGMWQTMMPMHAGLYAGARPTDPYANARVAHTLWKSRGWLPWTVYTSGAYRQYLPAARAAVANVTTSAPTTRDVAAVALTSPPPQPGLQPRAVQASEFVRKRFGWAGSIGGYATSGHITNSKHYQGLAIDIMTPASNPLSRKIWDYFRGPGFKPWGVDNVIFNHQIYNAGRGLHAYTGPNPHTTHVHVDFLTGTAVDSAMVPTGAVCRGGTVQASLGATTDKAFRVATYNLLGTSHTGRVSSGRRLPMAVRALARQRVDVVGFQEMQADQAAGFDRYAGGSFARYSAPKDTDNSLAWRRDVFTLDRASTIAVPYFDGHHRSMPVVRLVHRKTGVSQWFINVHNPAETARFHHQGQYRAAAIRVELATVRRLEARWPGEAVYLTGDLNERNPVTRALARGGMWSAFGSGWDWIDHIAGNRAVRFSGAVRDNSRLVDASSDHPLLVARAEVTRKDST